MRLYAALGFAGILALMAIATRALLTGAVSDAPPYRGVQEVSSRGGWSWFTDPRAISVGDTTFFTYVASDGDLVVSDGTTDVIVESEYDVDDHSVPALLVRASDQRLMLFYSSVTGDPLVVRVSTDPLDHTSWGSPVTIDDPTDGIDTYAMPVQLGSGTIHVYFRRTIAPDTDFDWSVRSSSDGGETWSSKTTLLREASGKRSYWRVAQNGSGRIDFIVSNGHPFYDDPTHTYHFYFDGSAYRTSAGSDMGSPPFTSADMTLVRAKHSWIWDIAVGADGHPRAVTVNLEDDVYEHHRWTGSSWVTQEVMATGGKMPDDEGSDDYRGGIVLDRSDPDAAYVSRKVGGQFELCRWKGGVVVPLTEGSGVKNVRPAPVYGGGSSPRVLWLRGDYDAYTDWSGETWAGH